MVRRWYQAGVTGPRSAALLATALLLVAGCGNPNGGQQAAADFETWLGEHPFTGMTVADTRTQEAIPYAGNADITVAVAPDDVAAAAEHVCGFQAGGWSSAAFWVVAERVTVPVDCADPATAGSSWQTIHAREGVSSARIDAYGIEAEVTDVTALLATWPALLGLPPWKTETDEERPLRITLQVAGGPMVQDDGEGVSVRARTVVRDLLAADDRVTRVSLTGETAVADEAVTVWVTRGADALERRLRAAYPSVEIGVGTA